MKLTLSETKNIKMTFMNYSLFCASWIYIHEDLVVLRLNVPVNNFSVMSGRSHRFLGN